MEIVFVSGVILYNSNNLIEMCNKIEAARRVHVIEVCGIFPEQPVTDNPRYNESKESYIVMILTQ